ncbi:MAG: hypothetical protein H6529_15205 [Nocardioides sp.]|nr:hypothetical protein [Nocardioidaceae bacterium]MCB8957812.1 hypothetical protein [Nocardioides sp.]
MTTIYATYPEAARLEIDQRVREAADRHRGHRSAVVVRRLRAARASRSAR